MTSVRLITASLLLLLLTPAAAHAELVIPDSGARDVFALDDTVVYNRVFGRSTPSRVRPWMRVVDGRRLRADGVPRGAFGNAIGRDHRGRVVLTMSRRSRGTSLWWIYDVRRDRARRLTSLPERCGGPQSVAIWRGRVAYVTSCFAGAGHDPDSGVFLRHRGTTRRLTSRVRNAYSWETLYLRGGLLIADRQEEDGDLNLWRLMDGGRYCKAEIPGAYLPAYARADFWVANRTVGWFVSGAEFAPGRGLAGALLAGRCERPGSPGALPVTELPSRRYASHDGRALYYTEPDGVHRLTPPSRPSTETPPNDAFVNAAELPGAPPFRVELTPGNATGEPGEPPPNSSPIRREGLRTAWYVFRPVASQRLAITSGLDIGVFTGSSVAALQRVSTGFGGSVAFDAQAGQTYYISAGCHDDVYCYVPQSFEIQPG